MTDAPQAAAETVIVRDDGFHAEDHAGARIDLPPDASAEALAGALEAPLVRIHFPAFNDGRGFSLARRLRALGFTGRLRAFGPLIADQYPLARRVGFDEVEIPAALAARQPADQWRAPNGRDYRSRLAG